MQKKFTFKSNVILVTVFSGKGYKIYEKLMCDIAEQKIVACCHKLHDATFPDF